MAESEIHRIAKESLALGFMRAGWMAGIEVSEDGSRFDVKVTKRGETYFFEVKFSHESDYWKWREQQKLEPARLSNESQQERQRPEWMTDKVIEDILTEFLYCDMYSQPPLNELNHGQLIKSVTRRNCSRNDAEMIIRIGKELGIISEYSHGKYSMSVEYANKLQEEMDKTTPIAGKSQSEFSILKVFMEVFNSLSGQDKNDVEERNFIDELIKTGKFTDEDARAYLRKGTKNGQIYERRTGWYAKA